MRPKPNRRGGVAPAQLKNNMTTLEYITDLKAENETMRAERSFANEGIRTLRAENEKLREIADNLANYYDHALPDGDWSRTLLWGIYQAAKAAIAKEAK